MNAFESAEWKRTSRRTKLRRDAERRDVYYYFTDLAYPAGNKKNGEVYNVNACFASVFTGLDWRYTKREAIAKAEVTK